MSEQNQTNEQNETEKEDFATTKRVIEIAKMVEDAELTSLTSDVFRAIIQVNFIDSIEGFNW